MPYKLKRIYVDNIRSLKNTEILIDKPSGVIRVGGRNGQGKSTAFYTGLYILLGLTSPLPHVTWNTKQALYEVENGYGRFGFKVEGRKVYYYYYLNTGERDMSDASVNNNRCIDVIRAYLGFNVDGEFKTVLNINSGKSLNFVVTNGRSELGFLKDMLYSEEIENLQALAVENEKYLKTELTRVSDKIHFINNELFNIKIYDEKWIGETVQWLNQVEKGLVAIDAFKTSLLNLLKHQLNLKKIERERIDGLGKLIVMQTVEITLLMKKKELNELKCIKKELIEARRQLSNAKQLGGMQDLVNLKRSLLHRLECREPLSNIKSYLKDIEYNLVRKEYLECGTAISLLNPLKGTVKDYLTADLEYKLSLTTYTKKNLLEVHLMFKNLNLTKVNLKTMKSHLMKAFLIKFGRELAIYKGALHENACGHFRGFMARLSEYRNCSEILSNLNKELDDKIYKDGRCILCYSRKS